VGVKLGEGNMVEVCKVKKRAEGTAEAIIKRVKVHITNQSKRCYRKASMRRKKGRDQGVRTEPTGGFCSFREAQLSRKARGKRSSIRIGVMDIACAPAQNTKNRDKTDVKESNGEIEKRAERRKRGGREMTFPGWAR